MTGPGTNQHVLKKDIGKNAPAAQNTGGFRQAGSATGPTSSQANYTATQDIGKNMPAAENTGGFRQAGSATGPTSSQANYTATQDIGKNMPAAGEQYWVGSGLNNNQNQNHP
jgi:nitrate reductase assembly molybdenum cofactor insertion protein NarJ